MLKNIIYPIIFYKISYGVCCSCPDLFNCFNIADDLSSCLIKLEENVKYVLNSKLNYGKDVVESKFTDSDLESLIKNYSDEAEAKIIYLSFTVDFENNIVL